MKKTLLLLLLFPILSFSQSPIVTINNSNPDTICCGDTYVVNGAVINDSAHIWTTSGDGTFTWPGNLHTVYTPGTNDCANGNVILTFTTYGYSPCDSAYDQMILNIKRKPNLKILLLHQLI